MKDTLEPRAIWTLSCARGHGDCLPPLPKASSKEIRTPVSLGTRRLWAQALSDGEWGSHGQGHSCCPFHKTLLCLSVDLACHGEEKRGQGRGLFHTETFILPRNFVQRTIWGLGLACDVTCSKDTGGLLRSVRGPRVFGSGLSLSLTPRNPEGSGFRRQGPATGTACPA